MDSSISVKRFAVPNFSLTETQGSTAQASVSDASKPASGDAKQAAGADAPDADALTRLASSDPAAAKLLLSQAALRTQLAAAPLSSSSSDPTPTDFLNGMEQALNAAQAGDVELDSTLLSKYTEYLKDVNALLTTIQTLPGVTSDGDPDLKGGQIIKAVEDFCNKWAGSRVVTTFDTAQQANDLVARFKGGGLKVVESGDGKYQVCLNYHVLDPIIQAAVKSNDIKTKAISGLDYGDSGDYVNSFANTDYWDKEVQNAADFVGVTTAAGLQALTLAADDTKRSMSTDSQLLADHYSRAVSQYDNLLKLYSSLASALTDTNKGFLQ